MADKQINICHFVCLYRQSVLQIHVLQIRVIQIHDLQILLLQIHVSQTQSNPDFQRRVLGNNALRQIIETQSKIDEG